MFFIYRLTDEVHDYYGQTEDSDQRLKAHKNPSCGSMSRLLDKSKMKMHIIHRLYTQEEADETEAFYQLNFDCVNKNIVGRTKQEFYQANKEKILEKRADYYQENKEKLNKKSTEYHKKNKEKIAAKAAIYREENKEKLAANKTEYYQENKEKILKQKQEYNQANKEKIAAKNAKHYQKNKDKIKAQSAEYTEKNKDKIKAREDKPYECECGSVVKWGGKATHFKSIKHQNYINQK